MLVYMGSVSMDVALFDTHVNLMVSPMFTDVLSIISTTVGKPASGGRTVTETDAVAVSPVLFFCTVIVYVERPNVVGEMVCDPDIRYVPKLDDVTMSAFVEYHLRVVDSPCSKVLSSTEMVTVGAVLSPPPPPPDDCGVMMRESLPLDGRYDFPSDVTIGADDAVGGVICDPKIENALPFDAKEIRTYFGSMLGTYCSFSNPIVIVVPSDFSAGTMALVL
jgi:hypothetical protein